MLWLVWDVWRRIDNKLRWHFTNTLAATLLMLMNQLIVSTPHGKRYSPNGL